MLGARLALGYTGRKEKVADFTELTIQGGRQASHQAAALNMRKAVVCDTLGAMDQRQGAPNNLQKSLGGGCFLEEVTGQLSRATGAKRRENTVQAAQEGQVEAEGPDQGGCARALYGVGVGAGEQHREGGVSVRRRALPCWAALLWPKDREAVRLVP